MKFVIILAALVAFPAAAEVIATARNTAGGEIRLTDERGKCEAGSRFFYATSRQGDVRVGCWQIVDGSILAKYGDNDDIKMYELDGFTIKQRKGASL